MKNILIGGVAKSGKSTLSEQLCHNHKYNHIPLDYVTASLSKTHPEIGIKSNVVINEETSNKLSQLLKIVIEIIDTKEEKFIIDTAHVFPHSILPFLNREKWDIYFIGYPNTNRKEKLEIIRKHETKDDWTYKRTDEEMLEILEQLIEISKKIKEECERYQVKFVDTSEDFLNSLQTFEN